MKIGISTGDKVTKIVALFRNLYNIVENVSDGSSFRFVEICATLSKIRE